jgi:addiction module HigA family antidote
MKRKMELVHPGAILWEDILKELNLFIANAASGLGVSRKQLSEVVIEIASISAEMAVRLEKGFSVNAEFWLDLQKNMISGKSRPAARFTATKASTIRTSIEFARL